MSSQSTNPVSNTDKILIHKLYELYKIVYRTIARFPKKDKYTLGVKIENTLLEIIELTVLAYSKNGASKLLIINKIDVLLRILRLFVRIGNDMKFMSVGTYADIEGQILEIGKIIGGWIKTTKGQ